MATGDDPVVISLDNIGRLDLKPGDTLVIVSPSPSDDYRNALDALVTAYVNEHHRGCHVMTLPLGTQVSVLPAI